MDRIWTDPETGFRLNVHKLVRLLFNYLNGYDPLTWDEENGMARYLEWLLNDRALQDRNDRSPPRKRVAPLIDLQDELDKMMTRLRLTMPDYMKIN